MQSNGQAFKPGIEERDCQIDEGCGDEARTATEFQLRKTNQEPRNAGNGGNVIIEIEAKGRRSVGATLPYGVEC
jgi:hypothetical protein